MKLGLEYIISVTSITNIPHGGAKASIDFYKSVRSAIGSCNIPKNLSDFNFVKTVTSAAGSNVSGVGNSAAGIAGVCPSV